MSGLYLYRDIFLFGRSFMGISSLIVKKKATINTLS